MLSAFKQEFYDERDRVPESHILRQIAKNFENLYVSFDNTMKKACQETRTVSRADF